MVLSVRGFIMPGIVGIVSRTRSTSELELEACLSAVSHRDWFASKKYSPARNVAFGAVYRKQRHDEFDYFEEEASQVRVLLSGVVFESSPHPRRLDAADIFHKYNAEDFTEWGQLDGSFVCAIFDGRSSKLHLINDRLGVLPLFYAKGSSLFAFAPEAKGILAHPEFTPSFDTRGVTAFLAAGYCLGSQTLFDGISMMLPATVLTVDADTLRIKTQRYWNLKYETRQKFKLDSDAESALREALVDSHRMQTCDNPKRTAIMLSGGWDSRGMLAFMKEIGRQFESAQTWGYRDDVPLSDASISRQLASRYQVPFDFTSYGTDTLIDNARSWCYVSELANDNFGWYAEGLGVLANSYDRAVDCLFVGDEIWGWGNDVTNEEESRAEVLPPHLPDSVRAILNGQRIASAVESYEAVIEEIMRDCDNDQPNDRKDYLYLYGRVARFIFSMGYYKELVTPIRRPFLSRSVIDVICGLSPRQRVYKRLYRSMLRRFAPEVADIPIASVNSLPDWNYDLRNKSQLRDYLTDLLDTRRLSNSPLGDILDVKAVTEVQQREFAKSVKPVRRSPNRARTLWMSAVRSGRLGHRLNHRLRPKVASHPAASAFKVIRRVALLSLLAQMFPEFDRPSIRHCDGANEMPPIIVFPSSDQSSPLSV